MSFHRTQATSALSLSLILPLVALGVSASPGPAAAQGSAPVGVGGSPHEVADAPHEVADGQDRPRIGLVLGGGGARGAAHVGVLKVLEELRIPVDLVVGTSMGAITGGLYAAGVSPREMEAWLEVADWDELFRDRPSYSELSYRRKREAQAFPIGLELGVGREGMQLPSGLIAGQKLNATLRAMTLRAALVSDFDSLAVPFRAVATDLERGEMVVLGAGDLVDAMRASMSAPGAFTPYPVGDRLLVDGGLLRNLPVDVAVAMGADVIIAVDVGAELTDRSRLKTPGQLTRQVTRIMTLSGATAQWAELRDRDVLILPQLGDQGSTDFSNTLAAVAAGEAAARRVVDRLSALGVDPATYRAVRERRESFGDDVERVDFVMVGPYTGRSPSSLLQRIATRPGPLDTVTLSADIDHLYGLGIYERVDYRLVRSDEENMLMLTVREKPWGPAYMRFRMSIRDRLDGEGTYSFAALLLVPQINSWGAELVGDLEVGEVRGVQAELYQPLGVRGLFYLAPSLRYRSIPLDVFAEGTTVARYRTGIAAGALEGGIHAGQKLEMALRLERGRLRGEPSVGPPEMEPFDIRLGMLQLRAEYDGLDDPMFPRRGVALLGAYEMERPWLGSDASYGRYTVNSFGAVSGGAATLFAGGAAVTSGPGGVPPHAQSGLGGFLLLSGYKPGEVVGNHMLFGRAMLFRAFRDDRMYAGFSLEAGNAWGERSAMALDDLLFSGALAVGFRTPLGPVYLGWGTRGEGSGVAYLVVGESL